MAEDQETLFNSLAGDDDDVDFQLSSQDQPAIKQRTAPPAHATLSFKLKIPKFEAMEEDHDLRRAPTDVVRTCSECGKQFTSGKALGGHKRACLQKKTPKPAVKKVVNNMQLDDQGHQSPSGLSCYVCKQSFRSLKSLYGHMRKHPEREWRGIQPPQAGNLCTNSSTISNSDDNDQRDDGSSDAAGSTVGLVERLKGWSVKARRGQRVSDAPVSTEEETEAMQQAVNDLLMLAEHCSDDCGGKKRWFDQASSVGSGYGVFKIMERRSDAEDGKTSDILRNFGEQGKGKTQAGAEDAKNARCNNSESTWLVNEYEDDSEIDISRKIKQLKKKKRRLTELDDIEGANEDPMNTQSSYYCPICSKAFAKHQALGGHVASHNKNKNVNTVKDSSESDAVSASEKGNRNANITSKVVENDNEIRQVASEDTGELSRIAAAAAADEHQCNICSKTFPTGQALGGHKRCHWSGPAEAFSSTSQVTTSAGEVTQTARRVVLDIDLNDTPAEYYQVFGGEAAVAAPS